MDAGTRHATAQDRGGTDSERVRDDTFSIVQLMLGGLNSLQSWTVNRVPTEVEHLVVNSDLHFCVSSTVRGLLFCTCFTRKGENSRQLSRLLSPH